MIIYKDNLEGISPRDLKDFFVDWTTHPDSATLYKILKNSDYKIIAYDKTNNKVIGFVNAITDKVFYSFIPLLEVLPEYQNKGIGKNLIKKMKNKLKKFYAIDICCDKDLVEFYKKMGFKEISGMVHRNYKKQKGN